MRRTQTLISDALDIIFNEQGVREKRFPFIVNTYLQYDYNAGQAVARLDAVFESLQGDANGLSEKPIRTLPMDYHIQSKNIIIEIDELQHFTPMRQASLAYYSTSKHLGFCLDEYIELCQVFGDAALFRGPSGYRRPTADFNFPNGRAAQRAYFDTLKDVMPVLNGLRPTIRIPVPALQCKIDAQDELVCELRDRIGAYL